MMLLLLLLIASIAVYFYWLKSRGLPPGPWGLPVVGYLPWLDKYHPHLTLTRLANKYGPIYSLKMGSVFTVVLSDAKLIRQAFGLEDFSGRAPLYLTHGVMKGNGIICVQGEKWKETRKFITSSLRTLGVVKLGAGREKMEADILAGVLETIDLIQKSAPQKPLDLEPILFHTMGNVVFKLVFGKTWSEEDTTWKTLQHLQVEGTKYIGVAGAINFLPFLRFLPSCKQNIKFLEDGIAFTHVIYQDILAEYKQSRQNSGEVSHIMGAYLREVERRGQDGVGYFDTPQFNFLMADMFGAGVDTTLTTLRWFLLYMALNPDVQAEVHEELDSMAAGVPVRLADAPQCPYLEACISETQRIRPVTPLGIPHGTVRDTKLAEYHIPAGTMVVPLQWAIHHNPRVYHNPDVFDPRRFLSDEGKLEKPEDFLPFQAGKRICPGEEYAKSLLFLFGGAILQNFHLSLPDGIVLNLAGETGITLTPPHHSIIFKLRQQ